MEKRMSGRLVAGHDRLDDPIDPPVHYPVRWYRSAPGRENTGNGCPILLF
jgi:hypothetical protein